MKTRLFIYLTVPLLFACDRRQNNAPDEESRLIPSAEVNQVEVVTLQRQDFPLQLHSNGKAMAGKRASLSFGASGTIAYLPVKNGQRVTAGTEIARLDRPDLELAEESARIAIQQARMQMFDILAGLGYALADSTIVPNEARHMASVKSGYMTALNNYKKAQNDLAGTRLTAPFSGRVANLSIKQYEFAGASSFCNLLDDSCLDVFFTVMESEYSILSIGLPVTIRSYADESRNYSGVLTEINPTVDKNSQIRIKAQVKNDGNLMDGMNVQVIVERNIPNLWVVPRSALVIRDNMDVVFTCGNDGKAHWNYVRIVAVNGDSYAIEPHPERYSRLADGDKVITSGNLNLADGSAVSIKQ